MIERRLKKKNRKVEEGMTEITGREIEIFEDAKKSEGEVQKEKQKGKEVDKKEKDRKVKGNKKMKA